MQGLFSAGSAGRFMEEEVNLLSAADGRTSNISSSSSFKTVSQPTEDEEDDTRLVIDDNC